MNVLVNDVYQKYNATLNTSGQLIVCADPKRTDIFQRKIVPETYQEYLESLEKRDPKKDQWVYNILDGMAKQDKILYMDDEMIIMPNYKWDGKNVKDVCSNFSTRSKTSHA